MLATPWCHSGSLHIVASRNTYCVVDAYENPSAQARVHRLLPGSYQDQAPANSGEEIESDAPDYEINKIF